MPNCSALYNHECISINGDRIPCCRFNDFDSSYNIKNSSIEDYLNSEYIAKIRSQMKSDWHSGCKKCKDEEDLNLLSLRNLYNRDHSFGKNIESIEFSLNKTCNLACRMCGPEFSSKWSELLKEPNTDLKKFVDNNTVTNSFSLTDIIPPERDLSNLRFIKYLGGEPFITKEIKDLFEILDKKNIIENISFFCSTNGTFFPSKYLKYLKKFKLIRMHISIDGVGNLNDYIRYGKNWNSVLRVIKLWKEYAEINKNIDLSLFTTVQAYNIHDINNLKELATQLGINFRGTLLQSPSYLSVNALPLSYINKIKNNYNEIYLNNYSFNKNDFLMLKEYTSVFDKKTNMNISNIIPELWKEFIR